MCMQIEQIKPNKPNFGLILALFCSSILILLVLAVIFVKADGKHLLFRHHFSQPHSLLLNLSRATDKAAV
jgi:hypothetical protein